MDLITALLLMLCPPREALPLKPPIGHVQTIPDPLPYVIDVSTWGPQ